jgi:[ribosomal protein S18]-alanine N-acetyltransferase
MTPQDMAALHARAFRGQRPWTAEEFAGLLASPHTGLVSGPLEFVLGRVLAGEAEILTLAVDPEVQRQGRARALVMRFLTDAAAKGAARAYLDVADDNLPARALYAQAGFREVGRRRGYFARADGPAADAIVMARDLPDS